MPLKAWLFPVHESDNQTALSAAAPSPSRDRVPVIQRCIGRAKASTSITTTPTTQTINSGAISAKLISGGVNWSARKELISLEQTIRRLVVRQRGHAQLQHSLSNDQETGADKLP